MRMKAMCGRLMSALTLIAVIGLMFPAQTVLAATVTKSFTNHSQASNPLLVFGGETFTYSVSGTWVGEVKLQKSLNGSDYQNFLVISSSFSTTPALTGTVFADVALGRTAYYRVYASTYTSGTIVTSLTDANDLVRVERNFKGVENLKFYDDGLVVPGTLAVTGAVSLSGALATTSGGVAASSGTSSGATSFKIKGAYTSAAIGALSALPGEVVFNFGPGRRVDHDFHEHVLHEDALLLR